MERRPSLAPRPATDGRPWVGFADRQDPVSSPVAAERRTAVPHGTGRDRQPRFSIDPAA